MLYKQRSLLPWAPNHLHLSLLLTEAVPFDTQPYETIPPKEIRSQISLSSLSPPLHLPFDQLISLFELYFPQSPGPPFLKLIPSQKLDD
jgi:hypothetical protein